MRAIPSRPSTSKGVQQTDPSSGRITKATKSKPRDMPPTPNQVGPDVVSPTKPQQPPVDSTTANEDKLMAQPVPQDEPNPSTTVAQKDPQTADRRDESIPQDSPPDQELPISRASDKQIIAGKTAPQFVLESMEAIKHLSWFGKRSVCRLSYK
ncbi:MAG: hypothetical protein Q8M16_09280 [Pirellulaceae bacterium]|nr:hypothetical protein [Pirellulaceae bacterium]